MKFREDQRQKIEFKVEEERQLPGMALTESPDDSQPSSQLQKSEPAKPVRDTAATTEKKDRHDRNMRILIFVVWPVLLTGFLCVFFPRDHFSGSSDEALMLAAASHGKNSLEYAQALQGKAWQKEKLITDRNASKNQRNTAASEATDLFTKAAALRLQLAGANSVLVSDSYYGLGMVAYDQKDYTKSQELFQNALEIAQRASDRTREAKYLHHLGLAYQHNGQLAEAISEFTKLAEAKKLSDRGDYARALCHLAGVYRQQGTFDKGILNAQLALNTLKKGVVADGKTVANAYYELGRNYIEKGQPREAVAPLQEAQKLRNSLYGENSWRSVEVKQELDKALAQAGSQGQ